MSKIMCDVCGTVFPKNASCCPICGWSPEAGEADGEGVIFENQVGDAGPNAPRDGRHLSSVFGHNWEEEGRNPDEPMGYPQHEELRQQFNSPLVIALVIVIILLLVATSVLFFGFFLPNHNKAVAVTEITTTDTYSEETETETPSVPCTGLVLTSGKAELQEIGQFYLIHVKVMPEDTTDAVQYISENPEVATVTESGKIIAVAEGDTSIMIVCGSKMIRTNVSVHLTPEETTVATTAATDPSEEAQAETEETAASEETTEETKAAEETTEATTEATTAPEETETTAETKPLKEVALKLTQRDVKLTVKRGQYTTLKLDCDLEPGEVEWSTSDASIAIVEDGKVYALANGAATITATYGDQKASCIVRCTIVK